MLAYFDEMFFISGNTPSSKNNRVWTGEAFVASENTQTWRRQTVMEWGNRSYKWKGTPKLDYTLNCEWGGGQRMLFSYLYSLLPKPINVEFTFIRSSRHRFDYINLLQTVMDEMTHHNWILDDDSRNIKPYLGDFTYDKFNPGTIIKIIKQL